MLKTQSVVRVVLPLLVCCLLAPASAFAQDARQDKVSALLKNARQSYYSLERERMQGFQCEISPDWAGVLKEQQKADPGSTEAAIAKLKQLNFVVRVDQSGNAVILHNEIPTENAKVKEGLAQIYGGMQQMMQGFFQTWSLFVIAAPLPESAINTTLEDMGAQYRLTTKEGSEVEIVTTMNKEYLFTENKINTKKFNTVFHPQFKRLAKGYLLIGYEATYVGLAESKKAVARVKIDYQPVSGLEIPKNLQIQGSLNGASFDIGVTLENCTASKK